MKVFFINTELVAESTPAIFVPTADNMFDNKYVNTGIQAGQPVSFGGMASWASVRFRVLPGKTYKYIRIGNSTETYGNKTVFADIDGNVIEYLSGYLTTFTVPENQSIAYVYVSCGEFADNNNKQLELSKMEPVIE